MNTIREIFTSFAPEYRDHFQDRIPENHVKAIKAITACRTENCGIAVYQCDQCRKTHLTYKSCGNRHCPNCQHHKTIDWLQRQNRRHLPGHHFMVTFTVPEQIRSFIRSNQEVSYGAMFTASSNTMKKLARDEKYIGGDRSGFFGVLHTWGRQLQYHPHIHYIVPGGALSQKDGSWHCCRPDFYLPVRAMSKIFKAKFRDLMIKTGQIKKIPESVWDIDWNVHCQPAGSGLETVRYLAPYVFKVAISNSRIVKVEDRRVYLKYRKPGSHRWRTASLDVMEFIRRFLQHVLPTGFVKVRYYGLLHPCSAVSLDTIRFLIIAAQGFEVYYKEPEPVKKTFHVCSDCGGNLKYCYSILPYMTGHHESG